MNLLGNLTFRLIGGAIGLALLASCAWLIKDRFHQRGLAQDAVACATAAADEKDTAPLDRCLPKVADEVRVARQARLCERSLLPTLRDDSRFAMAQSCAAGTKRLVAQADATAADLAATQAQLRAARAETTAAVTRAEARTATSNERERHGRTVIQAAPRDAGGIIRCDAECLRRLNGQ